MELCDELGVEGGNVVFGVAEGVGGGVLAEPEFHQVEEDAVAVEVGRVEGACLALPFGSQVSCDLFDEGGELVELLLWVGAVEEVEVGVVIDLSFLGPGVVLGGFCVIAGCTSGWILLFLHCDAQSLYSIFYDVRLKENQAIPVQQFTIHS